MFKPFLAILLALSLSGCIPALLGLGTEVAVTSAQERSAGNKVDDAGIYLKIKNAYVHADAGDLFTNVDVKVVEGRVLLAGNVDKPENQVEAVRLAWTVNGVREVINELQINDKSSLGNYLRDVWISSQIRTRLLAEKGVRSINYSVITVNQVVYLMGIAQNNIELNKVTYIASTTGYVQRVVNHVVMKSDARRPIAPQ